MANKEEVVLRVSSRKDAAYVKKVAGAVAWQLRENGYCKVRAVKADAVNTAIKAVAITNERLSQAGMTFVLDLFFSAADSGKQKNASTVIEMTIHELEEASSRPGNFVEYRVSGSKTQPKESSKRLAGAISSRADGDTGVRLRCIGPTSVYHAVKACCLAKGLAYSNGLQSIVVPTWSNFQPQEEKPPVSFIQLDFWTKKLSV
jgi:stage V sporulation protein SpoVS